MAGLASLTLRCLREDLALAVPRADTSLEEISHPLLAKATECFADDQTPHEGIAAIDDEVLFKVKAQRWRGAIWVDAGIPWLVAAGLREEGSPDDFYASLAARGKAARARYNAEHSPPLASTTYTADLLPRRDDDLRWRRDGGVLAQPGGNPAQGAQAAAVAAVAQLGVQPFGAADPFVPPLPQPVLVRAEQGRPGQAGAAGELIGGRGGGVVADRLPSSRKVRLISVALRPRASAAWTSACRALVRAARRASGTGAA